MLLTGAVSLCTPIVFVLAPVGGPTSAGSESSAEQTQCGKDLCSADQSEPKYRFEGAGRLVRDTRIGGARLLFTYRSRWPLFTFFRSEMISDYLRFTVQTMIRTKV